MSVPDQQSISFSHPVHTSTLQTLEVSGVFPVGTTTVYCNGYSVGGINANRQGDEFPTFDVTIVLVDTAEAASTIVIPSWIKNNAEWWADGLIDNLAVVTGLQWLITNGIMVIG